MPVCGPRVGSQQGVHGDERSGLWLDDIVNAIAANAGDVEKRVQESGPLSILLTRELTKGGAPVVCIDARAARNVAVGLCRSGLAGVR